MNLTHKHPAPRMVLGALVLGLFVSSAAGQTSQSSPAGMNAAMIKLFGTVTGFSSKAQLQVKDGTGQEITAMPMDFALLDGKVRVAVDLTQMKNKDMPPAMAASLKQAGMAEVVSVIRPDKKAVYIMYPQLKSYLITPFSKEDAEAVGKNPKIQKTAIGKETVEGHPCTKQKVTITDDKGQSVDAITWVAADLKDFPVQIQTTEKGNTSLVRFGQLRMARPDARDFEPPPDFAKVNSREELRPSVMKRLSPPGTAPAPAQK